MTSGVGRFAVFGATSYVGQFLLDALVARGALVQAVTRNPPIADILLHRFQGKITVCTPEDVRSEPVDAVINLAYVKQSNPVGVVRRNHSLVNAVHRAAVRASTPRVLHVSSAAVFGYRFDGAPRPGPAPRLAGDSYFELKADAERRLLREAAGAGYVPVIVRPGNILGPSSPAWVAGPAQRILSGRPLGLAGRDGFSNATYVRNLADYIVHVAQTPATELAAFGNYHHVAEFSGTRWSVFFQLFAETVGTQPLYVDPWTGGARSRGLSSLAAWAAQAYRAGALGVWTRRALGLLPFAGLGDRMYLALKTRLAGRGLREALRPEATDANYLMIVSAEHEFRSHLMPGWSPPVGLDQALAEMRSALASDGFALGAMPALHC